VADQPEITSAPVFVSTSSNPIIGAWVDGNITLSDGTNTYSRDVTEFDNIIDGVEFGTYDYTFVRSGGCYPEVTGTVTVDCDAISPQSGNVFLPIVADQPEITSAPVFVSTSSNPIIGAWVDGNITLSDGTNTYSRDVTEFDNIIDGVEFGTYDYTFVRSGGCYPEVTGTVTVDCDAISPQSGNVFLPIVADQPEITSAPVFVSTSSNPIIGAWVDGNITLSDGTNTYSRDVTEFDNIIDGVEFGTYDYTFVRSGGCYPEVTGTVTVDCDAISPQSGNVFLPIVADQPEITELDTSVVQTDNILTANAEGLSYQWINCDTNEPIEGATEQTFMATENGSYAVVLTLESCGLSDTSECIEVNSLSQTEFGQDLTFSIFPNPVKNNLNIRFNTPYHKVEVIIYSLDGKLMNRLEYSQVRDTSLDISKLSSGTYVVNVKADGKEYTKRVIKN
jgi:hypothetical protein